jgi:transcriptional regulator with XRE-family HTH domain
MTIVSNNIKYLRRLNGLTQEQFSRRIGIKRSLLGAYEEARANPNLDNLQNMAKIFGTTVDALIKTDIRKIRETPGLNYQNNTQKPSITEEPTNITPIASVIDKYFTDVPVGPVRNVNQEPDLPVTTDNFIKKIEPVVNSYEQPINTNSYSTQNQVEGIPLINKNELQNYISKRNLNAYLGTLPKIIIPSINSILARAFTANEEFPAENATIIGEMIEKGANIHEGQHHILICFDGRLLFRRVYDHTRIKGVYLLSSDDHNIPSTEVPESQVVELYKFVAHIGYSVPKSTNQNPRIKNLIEELYRESGRC